MRKNAIETVDAPGMLRYEVEKQVKVKLRNSGISLSALKKEKLAYELLVCQEALGLQSEKLRRTEAALKTVAKKNEELCKYSAIWQAITAGAGKISGLGYGAARLSGAMRGR
jgi:hypothetical protein